MSGETMLILGIDPGPTTSGVVVYDSAARRVVYSDKAATEREITYIYDPYNDIESRIPLDHIVIERPAAMGPMGAGKVGHMLDTAWAAGRLEAWAQSMGADWGVHTLTRREVLRNLGVMSGKGSADARVRAACIADHGGTQRAAVGVKREPGPLYGVTSHSWQALGLVLAWLEMDE